MLINYSKLICHENDKQVREENSSTAATGESQTLEISSTECEEKEVTKPKRTTGIGKSSGGWKIASLLLRM